MNALFAPSSRRWLLLFALAVCCLPLLTANVLAGDGPLVASSSLQANIIFEMVSDRTRMIQASLVMVTLGIGLLWWTRT